MLSCGSPSHTAPTLLKSGNKLRRHGSRWLALLPALLICSCDNPEKLDSAIEALKTREQRVVTREASLLEHEQSLAEKERQLAESAAKLEKERRELEAKRTQLLADIAKAKRYQEALLLREKRGPAPKVVAERVMVIDPESDEVLLERNADRKGPIASTQKLLTALLVVESGRLDEMMTIEEADCKCPPVRIGLKAGETYSRRSLLTALMVKSSNDIAQALARDHAGSQVAFAAQMNARAKELGMNDSHFVNPNGLPADGQYSTARDLAKLAKAADALPQIRAMVSNRTYTFKRPDGREETLENTNRVLRTYQYCDGMKTGYTNLSGYCLVASGEKEGRRRIVVVLNSTSYSVWRDAQALLEWSLQG
ncbi:D-alanyl-D-alanine carboxypeptidase-like protein [Roseimicrobium gellanilyticum]|uniref:D-alanyl-D-alanine carboxypeptidase-like protein n=1 Tax=Roseimicrobium gellanilyticum TaxID=748857 RepID=A0A366HPB7_9BACT|nr:serine hydrolase [Roseimicrobium gellanilyticum]RBP45346.1 D-alanyl-D-alanine carboxypeptidase-like protein [Roseimicrobium gellanilyticum]